MKLSEMQILYADAETYYDAKTYTLKKTSMTEYIRDPRFKCHGFGFAIGDGSVEWVEDVERYIREIDPKKTALVAHNLKFDGAILAWKYGFKPALYIDTQAMSRAVYGTTVASHSLDFLGKYLGLQSKGIMLTDGLNGLNAEQKRDLIDYNKVDVILLRDIFKAMRPLFPESQYGPLHWTVQAFVEPQLVLNWKLAEKCAIEETIRRENIIASIGIDRATLASNYKFAALLTERGYDTPMKASPKQKNEDGTAKNIPALALGDSAFLDMLDSQDDELRALCEARVAVKSNLLPTRAAKFALVGKGGPWPFDVQYSGAKQTHRYSGGKGAGGNPQNLPRGSALRECICAPEGYSLVVGDFANIELRVVAYLSGDKGLVGAIENKRDLYCDFASAYYGRIITKADEAERRFGKTAILGLGYGMGAKKFKKTVKVQLRSDIPDEAAEKAVKLYRSMYSGVCKLWTYLDNSLYRMASGEVWKLPSLSAVQFDGSRIVLPSGLSIKYTNLKSSQDVSVVGVSNRNKWSFTCFREKRKEPQIVDIYGGKVLENLSQALAGEMCKEAIERIRLGSHVVGQVHDEILSVTYESWAEDEKARMEREMSKSPSWWPEIKLAAEVGIGKTWASAKH